MLVNFQNDKLYRVLELNDGDWVFKGTLITASLVLAKVAEVGIDQTAASCGLTQEQIRELLYGISQTLDKSAREGIDQNELHVVAEAYSQSVGLPFSPQDRRPLQAAKQFLMMLRAATEPKPQTKSWRERRDYVLSHVKKVNKWIG